MELQLTNDKKFLQILSCTETEYDQFKLSLTKRIDGFRFHPLVKKGIWDGYISYVKGNKIPAGLWQEVMDIGKQYNFDMKMHGVTRLFNTDFDKEDFLQWQEEFFKDGIGGNPDKKPRDYQIETAARILKYRRCLAELATSAGKSLIVFMVLAYVLERTLARRVLLIVPNVSLVLQASEDFDDYNQDQLKLKIQQIGGGAKEIKANSNLVVGTYQSLVKKSEQYFKQFDAVIVDECLHPDSLITMADGSKKKISDIRVGEFVKTYNIETNEIEDKEVDFVYKNLSKGQQMFELEMEDGRSIKITGNHKVQLSSGEWKRVDELKEDDDIVDLVL